MQGKSGVLAGIVVYHPDEDHLRRLVAAVAPDADEVAVFANSPLPDGLEASLRLAAGGTAFAVLGAGANLGLGAAYDAFLDRAGSRALPFAFLLDQDSLPRPGTIPALVARHRELTASGERPAVVGPQPLDPAGEPMRLALSRPDPAPPRPGLIRVAFVISSGSLVSVEAARTIGPFRADFFIDAIDLEWCFRAGAAGFSIWVAAQVAMDHRLGRGVIALPFGLLLADQPNLRLYTFIRNQLAMLRLSHVPRAHKLKTVLSLPVRIPVYLARNRFSRECRSALWNGLVDGALNRLGPPTRAAGTRR